MMMILLLRLSELIDRRVVGFHVISTVRKENLLEQLREKGFSAVLLDVTDEGSIARCRDEVEKMVDGKLDVLVNNA